ncbi:MAG: HTH domain-containing protein [Bacilli bacterium]|nr:HTH domain-containing protein [Bacilli bacterium]
MERETLTLKQKEILQMIKKFIADNSYPPTVREIAKELNIASTATIHFHIKHLVEKGYLSKGEKNRDLKLLVPNEFVGQTNSVVHVPFIDWNTQNIIESIQIPTKLFPIPTCLLSDEKKSFILQVQNQHLENYGIQDNDILIVEKKITANHNEIIVFLSKEKALYVKKIFKKENQFYFYDNHFEPLSIHEFIIIGKVIGLYRTF